MTKKKQLKRMLLSGILVGAFAYSGLTAYGAVIGITADIVDTADGFVIKPGGDGTSATPYVYFHNSDSTFTSLMTSRSLQSLLVEILSTEILPNSPLRLTKQILLGNSKLAQLAEPKRVAPHK